MSKAFFQRLEGKAHNHRLPLSMAVDNLSFNEQGLIPVITQDHSTKAVLMQAWRTRKHCIKPCIQGVWFTGHGDFKGSKPLVFDVNVLFAF